MMSTFRGMGRYTREIILALIKLDNYNTYYLYTNKPINFKIPENFHNILTPQNEIIAEQIYLPFIAKKNSLDILWCPANTFPIFLSSKIKLIVTIHDLIFFEKFNKNHKFSLRQRIGKFYRKYNILWGKNKINTCLTVSQYSAKQIEEKLKLSNIVITYNRIDSFYNLYIKHPNCYEQEDFYFTVSGDAPSKNLQLLIDTFKEYLPDKKLIIAGVSNRATIRKEQNQQIIFLPMGIEDNKLIQYYSSCKAFVFVSLFEGFGIPILEALACNAPIVCSNTTSIPEIISNHGIQVDPKNKKEIAQALINIENYPINEQMRVNHLKKFLKWEDTAKIVLNQFHK